MSRQDDHGGSLGAPFHRAELDGLPVIWAEGPEPFSAGLVFRVGVADETLPTSGITHLVEHLAFTGLHRPNVECAGSIDHIVTEFEATGTVAEVFAVLEAIGGTLANLPLDRLELEKRLLLTEAAGHPPGPGHWLMAVRFGAAGHGLIGYEQLGLRHLDEAAVTEWVRTRLTRGNAAVWMTGPPPARLPFDLPTGARIGPPEPVALPDLRLPAQAEFGSGGVGLSLLARQSAAVRTALDIAEWRAFRSIRTDRGLTYHVEASAQRLTADSKHEALVADCLDEHAGTVRDELLNVVRGLATDGPTPDELEQHVKSVGSALKDPRGLKHGLANVARLALLDVPFRTKEEVLREYRELEADDVREAIAAALDSTLILVPEGGPGPRSGFNAYRPGAGVPVEGRAHVAKLAPKHAEAVRARLIVGSDGVSLVPPGDQETVTVRFRDCVAVVEGPGGAIDLIGRDGAFVGIDPADFRQARAAIEEIERRLDPALVVPIEERAAGVEAVATEKVKRRWLAGEALDLVAPHLAFDERVENLAVVSRGLRGGVLAVTDRRAIFASKVLAERIDDYPFDAIESVRGRTGLLSGKLVLRIDGENVKFSISPKRRAREIGAYIASRLAGRSAGQ